MVNPGLYLSLAQVAGHQILDGATFFQTLLHLNEKLYTINQILHKVHLRFAETVTVGDIVGASSGSSVNTTSSTLLQTVGIKELIEARVARHVGDLDMHASTETGSQVGGAGQDVTKMLGPHELPAFLSNVLLHLLETVTESLEHTLDVATLLHGDDTSVVLLVDPDEEVLGFVVPDTTGIGPVTSHTRAQEEGRYRLVKQEVVVDKLLLFCLCHLAQRIVLASKIALKVTESINNNALYFTTFGTGACWGEGKPTNATSSTHTGRENVLGVEVTSLDLRSIQVSGVLVPWLVTIVTIFNDSIHKRGKYLIGFFITSDDTDSHNERVTRIIDTSLDTLIEGPTVGRDTITKLSIHSRGQIFGHDIVVLGEVWVVAASRELKMSI